MNISPEDVKKFVDKLPPLKKGGLDFTAYTAHVQEDGRLVLRVVIRNGSGQKLTLKKLPLGVRDAKGRNVATGLFIMEDFVIEPKTAHLKTFKFPAPAVLLPDADLSKVSIYIAEGVKNEIKH